jgi:antibiotic biosynthesis monooxygenase (ABM) superfamily enzyme
VVTSVVIVTFVALPLSVRALAFWLYPGRDTE